MARAVAYSPDGTSIAVGIGGRVGRGKNRDDGKWLVIRESDLEKVRGLLNMQCAGVRREGCEAELVPTDLFLRQPCARPCAL